MALENIFERHGYGPDGMKHPEADLHAVSPESMTFVDRLRAAGITVFHGDSLILSNPDQYGNLAEATIRDYEILLDQALAQAALASTVPPIEQASIMPEDWQQSA